jgi:hypothetical protein
MHQSPFGYRVTALGYKLAIHFLNFISSQRARAARALYSFYSIGYFGYLKIVIM